MEIGSVREIALALPEVTEAPHFDHGAFRVRDRIFATVPPDQRHLHVMVDEQTRLLSLEVHGDAMAPLYWGKRIPGLRIDLVRADARTIEQLVRAAWRHKAPRRLAAALDAGDAA